MAQTPRISVIVPTYDEAPSIEAFLLELLSVLDSQEASFEVIVVDDDSPDGTAARVQERFGQRDELRVLLRRDARGLAFSIREGIEQAQGQCILVMDADFNHDPRDLPRLLERAPDHDLVSGSRFVPGGGMYSRKRYAGSYLMNLLIRGLLPTQLHDHLAGYFLIHRSALEKLPFDTIFRGYGDYYLRLLLHAQRQGLRIVELPVVYRPRLAGRSKTQLLRTALRYSREVLRLALA